MICPRARYVTPLARRQALRFPHTGFKRQVLGLVEPESRFPRQFALIGPLPISQLAGILGECARIALLALLLPNSACGLRLLENCLGLG